MQFRSGYMAYPDIACFHMMRCILDRGNNVIGRSEYNLLLYRGSIIDMFINIG